MDVTTLRARIAAAPTTADVDAVMRDVYAVLGTKITEDDAAGLERQAQDRRGRPGWQPDTAKPLAPPRRLGSTPRTPASMERRREWAAGGWLPPEIAKRYTLAGQAVLAVIAAEIAAKGLCDLPISAIGAKAGTSDTATRDALRRARDLGHIQSTERRRSYDRSDTSLRQILHRGWSRWLARRSAPNPGVELAAATSTQNILIRAFPRFEAKKIVFEDRGRSLRRAISASW